MGPATWDSMNSFSRSKVFNFSESLWKLKIALKHVNFIGVEGRRQARRKGLAASFGNVKIEHFLSFQVYRWV